MPEPSRGTSVGPCGPGKRGLPAKVTPGAGSCEDCVDVFLPRTGGEVTGPIRYTDGLTPSLPNDLVTLQFLAENTSGGGFKGGWVGGVTYPAGSIVTHEWFVWGTAVDTAATPSDVTWTNLGAYGPPKVLVLGALDPVPPTTPVGTVIVRLD